MKKLLLSLTGAALVGAVAITAPADAASSDFTITELSIMDSGFGEGGAEIPTYHVASKQVFATNGANNSIDIYNIADVTNPKFVRSVSMDKYGDGITSVAAGKRYIAVAVTNDATYAADGAPELHNGKLVVLYPSGNVAKVMDLGAVQPDAVTFTPNGTTALVAIEGEPICALDNPATTAVDESLDYKFAKDPKGALAIIDLRSLSRAKVKLVDFSDISPEDIRSVGGVVSLTSGDPAVDLEPEYVSAPRSSMAFVTLQEANLIAQINVVTGKLVALRSAGVIDRSVVPFDSSDRDAGAGLRTYDNVYGLAMPDAIAAFQDGNDYYTVTANEGDDRADWTCFTAIDDARVKDLEVDTTVFTNWDVTGSNEELGRAKVNPNIGDEDGDGKYESLYLLGGRSMSIMKNGQLIYDSGALLAELQVAALGVENINGAHDVVDGAIVYEPQNRSDDKGAEPEGVAVGMVGNSRVAVLGLERMSALVFFDITDPANPEVISWEQVMPLEGTAADAKMWSPEGVVFIDAADSPNGKPLVLTSYEMSGTISLHSIEK